MSQPRVLLNAEPFGFGPAAAMADFFPLLRQKFSRLEYIGERHTLHLHSKLGYDCVHDVTNNGADDKRAERIQSAFANADVFFTALDFAMAEKALEAGLRVYIYDPLTWYWKAIHPVVAKCHLYMAQDFYGVKERIAAAPASFNSPVVVQPAIPSLAQAREKKHVLLNLGGLNNPMWSDDDTLAYARVIVEASYDLLTAGKQLVVIAANATIARELDRYGVKHFPRSEMQNLLSESVYALMTPGLGNIYDAARFATPTIWLPPANDSQGLQLRELIDRGIADGALDWHSFAPELKVDYRDEQNAVLKRISHAVQATSGSAAIQSALRANIAACIQRVRDMPEGRCSALVDEFGSGGVERVVQLVEEQVRKDLGNVSLSCAGPR